MRCIPERAQRVPLPCVVVVCVVSLLSASVELEWMLNSMTKMKASPSVLAVMLLGAAAIPFAVSLDSANPDLILTNIDRKIDLSTQLVKVQNKTDPTTANIGYKTTMFC